jgi:hypothetical protein
VPHQLAKILRLHSTTILHSIQPNTTSTTSHPYSNTAIQPHDLYRILPQIPQQTIHQSLSNQQTKSIHSTARPDIHTIPPCIYEISESRQQSSRQSTCRQKECGSTVCCITLGPNLESRRLWLFRMRRDTCPLLNPLLMRFLDDEKSVVL